MTSTARSSGPNLCRVSRNRWEGRETGSMTSAAVAAPAVIPGGAARMLTRVVHGISLLATIAAATALLIELAVVLVSIAGRTLVGHGPLWSDEASRLAVTIIAFIV